MRQGVSTGLPTKATRRGHVWTWDFVSDATVRGGALKMLTILDEHTRECHVLRPDRAMRAADVLTWLERAIKIHGAPAFLRSDNGPEFIAREVQRWLSEQQIKTLYIDPGSPWQNGFVESFHGRLRDECLNQDPGSPWQNGFVESFHGRLRDECLNQEQLWTLTEARVVIEDFRCHYNERRPHGKLGYQSPVRFAALQRQLTSALLTEAGQTQPTQLHTNQPQH